MNGTAPEKVRVRKEYDDDCDAPVEGRAEVTQDTVSVLLSSEGCSSSGRYLTFRLAMYVCVRDL